MQKQATKLLERINKAQVIGTSVLEDQGLVRVVIKYNNKLYTGKATLHEEDKDFFSKLIGRELALTRAQRKALRDEISYLKATIQQKKQFFFEVTHYNNEEDTPLKLRMERNIYRAEQRLKQLQEALDNEDKKEKDYLVDLDKTFKSVKAFRAKTNKSS